MLRGGLSLAAGSDGCVFDGTFAKDGTFTRDPARVTKVYLPQGKSIAENEWEAMELVMNATNGEGVVVAEGPPQMIDVVVESAFEDDTDRAEGRSGYGKGACEKLVEVLTNPNPHPPLPTLIIPRINGSVFNLYIDSMRNNRRLVLPEASFAKLRTAVDKMRNADIVHMDFATRNIFYKKEEDGSNTLLLGDFGNTFKIGADIKEKVQAYVTGYNFRGVGRFLACTKVDGVHPIAVALMILYDAYAAGQGVYEALLNNEIRKNNYLNRTKAIAEATWAGQVLKSLASRDPSVKPAVDNFINTLATKFKVILGIFADDGRGYEDAKNAESGIRGILQKTLKRSDKCLLELMVLIYQKDALSLESVTKLTELWFPVAPPKPGGKRQGGEKMPEQAESLEEALARPDPTLTDDPVGTAPGSFPPIAEGLAQLEGGVRKGHKTRRNRTQLSKKGGKRNMSS